MENQNSSFDPPPLNDISIILEIIKEGILVHNASIVNNAIDLLKQNSNHYIDTLLYNHLKIIFLKNIGSIQLWPTIDQLIKKHDYSSMKQVATLLASQQEIGPPVFKSGGQRSTFNGCTYYHIYENHLSSFNQFKDAKRNIQEPEWRTKLKQCIGNNSGEALYWGIEIARDGKKRKVDGKYLPVYQVFKELESHKPEFVEIGKKWYEELRHYYFDDSQFCWILPLIDILKNKQQNYSHQHDTFNPFTHLN